MITEKRSSAWRKTSTSINNSLLHNLWNCRSVSKWSSFFHLILSHRALASVKKSIMNLWLKGLNLPSLRFICGKKIKNTSKIWWVYTKSNSKSNWVCGCNLFWAFARISYLCIYFIHSFIHSFSFALASKTQCTFLLKMLFTEWLNWVIHFNSFGVSEAHILPHGKTFCSTKMLEWLQCVCRVCRVNYSRTKIKSFVDIIKKRGTELQMVNNITINVYNVNLYTFVVSNDAINANPQL